MKDKTLLKSIVNTVIGLAILLIIWLISYLVIGNSYVMPSPLNVLKNFVLTAVDLTFLKVLAVTLLRVILAFIISLTIAIILALLSYKYPSMSEVLSVIIGFLR